MVVILWMFTFLSLQLTVINKDQDTPRNDFKLGEIHVSHGKSSIP